MVCTDANEADELARRLLQLNNVRLVTYRRMQDLLLQAPAGKASLVVLATCEGPTALTTTLGWLRKRWPGCPLVVIGDEGGAWHEQLARSGGATFLTRPVSLEQWDATVACVERLASRDAETVA